MDERVIEWKQFGETVLDPLALGFTLLLGIALLFVPRHRALLPMLLASCLIPIDQRLVVGGLDFNMIRLLVLFGWTRVLSRGEHKSFRWHPIDIAFLAWLASSAVINTLRGGSSAFIWSAGLAFEASGTYFLFRFLLRTPRDLQSSVGYFALIAVPFAAFMTLEFLTGRNVFAVLGGVPQFTVEREGRLRCQGAFAHPILAGDFGGGLAPMILGYAIATARRRVLSLAALAASVVIVVLSASSGPLLSLIGGGIVWLLWPLRRMMNLVRWALVAAAVFLQLVMNHPIWFVFAALTVVGGSTGWHRYALIDAFFRHFTEWALLGIPSTGHWGWGLNDVTNHFVLEGVRGGLTTFLCFVTIIGLCFRSLGVSLSRARRLARTDRTGARLEYLAWGIGGSLFAHMMAMTAVAYVDQILILLFALLATIPSLEQMLAPRPVRVRAPQGAAVVT